VLCQYHDKTKEEIKEETKKKIPSMGGYEKMATKIESSRRKLKRTTNRSFARAIISSRWQANTIAHMMFPLSIHYIFNPSSPSSPTNGTNTMGSKQAHIYINP
jgi:hypothetical protein